MGRVDDSERVTWWTELRLAEAETVAWRIGCLRLAVRRSAAEWQMAYEWEPEDADVDQWEMRSEASLPAESAQHERFVVGSTGDRLRLEPALADRPVVSLPRLPIRLLPECEATLFVGSPMWVRVQVGEPAVTLRELPSHRLSDTWFGGSTRDGELCYATQTRARLLVESLPVLSRSAVTAVRIRNQASSPLSIERLKLPVPMLSLFCDELGRLWTEEVTLTRGEESEMASLDIGSGPPPEATGAEVLTPPRSSTEPNLWIRAFSGLLGIGRREE